MRRILIWLPVVLVVLGAGILAVWFYSPMSSSSSRQIAAAMLEYYNQCATNGYHAFDSDLPSVLRDLHADYRPGRDVQTNYAAIGYAYERLGIYCEMTFYFERSRTNDTTWILTRQLKFTPPIYQKQILWSKQLITITNSP